MEGAPADGTDLIAEVPVVGAGLRVLVDRVAVPARGVEGALYTEFPRVLVSPDAGGGRVLA